jgi:hypothetical protein
MRFAINLRSDLAKLSDAELSSELQRLKEYWKARFESEPRFGSVRGVLFYADGWPFGRGPIFARWAYKILIGYFWPYRGRRGTLYLVECEIKDLNDEIQRRLKARITAPLGVQ